MATKRRARWKGHCYMCAMNKGKIKNGNSRENLPFAVLRVVGRTRRVSRRDLRDGDR